MPWTSLLLIFSSAAPSSHAGEPEEPPAPVEERSPDLSLEPTRIQEPVPVGSVPVPLQVKEYLLPRQDPAWFIAAGDYMATCRLEVTWLPAGSLAVRPLACPEEVQSEAAAAISRWVVEPAWAAAAGVDHEPSRFEVALVAEYHQRLAVMTFHARIDPGREAAFDGLTGPPGLKLVRPAEVVKRKTPSVPRKLRGDDELAEASCVFRAHLAPDGRIEDLDRLQCPEPLIKVATKAALRHRFLPRVEDGVTMPEVLELEVAFR